MRLVVGSLLILAGCSGPEAPGHERREAPRDDQGDIVREALSYQIREYEAIQRRASGLPGVVFVGTVSRGGREPIGDVDPGLLAKLRSDTFTIRQASLSEIRGKTPGPNFITDRVSGERGIRILADSSATSGDAATIEIFNAMSSYDGVGAEYRLTLKRDGGAWKVERHDRRGGMP